MNKYIPVYELAEKRGISRQKIYRLIREGKIPEDKVKKVTKVVERIVIADDVKV